MRLKKSVARLYSYYGYERREPKAPKVFTLDYLKQFHIFETTGLIMYIDNDGLIQNTLLADHLLETKQLDKAQALQQARDIYRRNGYAHGKWSLIMQEEYVKKDLLDGLFCKADFYYDGTVAARGGFYWQKVLKYFDVSRSDFFGYSHLRK